jgi:hypothetical protein
MPSSIPTHSPLAELQILQNGQVTKSFIPHKISINAIGGICRNDGTIYFPSRKSGSWEGPAENCRAILKRTDTLYSHIRKAMGFGHILLEHMIDNQQCLDCAYESRISTECMHGAQDSPRIERFAQFWGMIRGQNMQYQTQLHPTKRKRDDPDHHRRRDRYGNTTSHRKFYIHQWLQLVFHQKLRACSVSIF